MKKRIPRFKTEDEEREFWQTHDSTEYVDWDQAAKTILARYILPRSWKKNWKEFEPTDCRTIASTRTGKATLRYTKVCTSRLCEAFAPRCARPECVRNETRKYLTIQVIIHTMYI
jgi:hypothetical protein